MLSIILSAQTTGSGAAGGDEIALALPTPEIVAAIERDISLEKLQLFTNRSWPGFGMVGIANRTDYRPWPPKPLRMNKWWFPIGATRYAFGAFLCSKDQADALHDYAFGANGTETNPVTLVLSSDNPDDSEASRIEFELLTLMPPVPLYLVLNDDNSSDHGMYVIVLVDDRFFWNDVPLPDLGITESANKSWTDCFTAIKTALNLDSLDVDTIDAKFLAPSRALNLTNEPIPMVLDAICTNISHRLVVDFNGDVFTQSFKTALTALDKDIQDEEDKRPLRAGGDLYADAY